MKELSLLNSGLEWTIVQPPQLNLDSYTGKYLVSEGIEKDKTRRLKLSRADLAEFMLKQLEDKTYIRKSVFVTQ
jgi:hypothetical protein